MSHCYLQATATAGSRLPQPTQRRLPIGRTGIPMPRYAGAAPLPPAAQLRSKCVIYISSLTNSVFLSRCYSLGKWFRSSGSSCGESSVPPSTNRSQQLSVTEVQQPIQHPHEAPRAAEPVNTKDEPVLWDDDCF